MNIEEAKAHCEMLLNYGILSSEDEEPMKTVLSELEKKDEYIKMLTDERDTLIKERDYYKARYNEFNEAFIKMKS